MADLIDRWALLKELATHFNKMIDGKTLYSPPMALAMRDVRAAPAVDAEEVVRCKDCKHMKLNSGMRFCNVWVAFNGAGDDGFCNYGERRTDDATKDL